VTVFKTYRMAASTHSFAGKRGGKEKRKKETLRASSLLVAVCILRIAARTRLMHATTMHRAFGPNDAWELWSRIKATTTHAAALSLTRNAFTTKFVNPLTAAKFRRPFLAGGLDRESTREWRIWPSWTLDTTFNYSMREWERNFVTCIEKFSLIKKITFLTDPFVLVFSKCKRTQDLRLLLRVLLRFLQCYVSVVTMLC